MTHDSIAKRVRLTKEAHPERYCPVKDCLWRTKRGEYCPRHYAEHLEQWQWRLLKWGLKAERFNGSVGE